jgi:hypothetical protein
MSALITPNTNSPYRTSLKQEEVKEAHPRDSKAK